MRTKLKTYRMIAIIVAAFQCLFSASTLAKGTEGTGGSVNAFTITYTKPDEPKQPEKSHWRRRHEIGLEYALDENSEFSRLLREFLEEEAAKALVAGVVPGSEAAMDIAIEIRDQIELAARADTYGVDAQLIIDSVVQGSEVFVGVANPGAGVALPYLKMVTAFMTAYAYGTLWG